MSQVRRASAGDVPALLPLIERYWRFEQLPDFDPAIVGAQLERLLTHPALGAAWIAHDADGARGYLLAVYVFSLEHLGLTAEIDELFVAESARSQGLGAQLLAAAEAEFLRISCKNTSLQLGRNNHQARAFYLRQGYQPRAGFELLDKPLCGE
jgi:GNAT superfamily N-acetyltransferase